MLTIIGLDLGKFNSAACTFLTGDGEVRFQLLPTKIAALRQLFERERPDLVVFEACAQAGLPNAISCPFPSAQFDAS